MEHILQRKKFVGGGRDKTGGRFIRRLVSPEHIRYFIRRLLGGVWVCKASGIWHWVLRSYILRTRVAKNIKSKSISLDFDRATRQ